jgi:hypothetical protein
METTRANGKREILQQQKRGPKPPKQIQRIEFNRKPRENTCCGSIEPTTKVRETTATK